MLGRRWAVAITVGLAVALFAAGLLSFTSGSEAATQACTSNQQQGTLCVSVTDTPDPVSYSALDGNSTFISYRVVVTNQSRSSSLSHVGLTDTLPEGTTFVSATPSVGNCSVSGQTVTCSIGSLKRGKGATVDIVVTAPATSDLNPADRTIANTVTASFDESFNDQPNGGKQDSATATETTVVSKSAGQTFVPRGHSGKVNTDPAQPQYANASIPSASTDVLATIKVLSPDDFCVDGTVRVGNKNYVCRLGGFVDVSVADAASGASYSNAQNPLVFHLRWGPELVSGRQTVRNFVVFYRTGATAPIQVNATQCNATASNVPCLKNTTPEPDGGWSTDFVKQDNGRMR